MIKNKDKWFEKLLLLKENSYSVYSKFKVSCICILKNNKEFIGVNIENCSFSVTICAERVCISQVYSAGYNKNDIKKIYLYTDSKKVSLPCGMCIQFMSELVPNNVKIKTYNKYGKSSLFFMNQFLLNIFSF